MSTAKQLIPSFVEAEPLTWDRPYSKNMRPIRGYPDYWRIIDTEAYVDGPSEEGVQWDGNLYLWRAKILRDDNYEFTDTIEVVNLGDYLSVTSSEVNGQTVYRYKYNSSINSFQYQHTDIIDSVSIEFDQSGRRLIAFESTGNVYFLWYDSQLGAETLTNFGLGKTPYIVTDTYRRGGGSAASERLLFYVKDSTKQIVYRRQIDRYGIEYSLPTAPNDVVEILRVSKNIYGGLTVLYCYDDGLGNLLTGSFTATAEADVVNVGTDGDLVSNTNFIPVSSTFGITLKVGGIQASGIPSVSNFVPTSGTISSFELRPAQIFLQEQIDTSDFILQAGGTATLFLKQPVIYTQDQINNTTFVLPSGDISAFTLKFTLITASSYPVESSTFILGSGSITTFTLG